MKASLCTRSHACSVPRRRTLSYARRFFVAMLVGVGSGCSTGAVAVQQCREIESARCEAAPQCELLSEGSVANCKRFYSDQCLHGIYGDTEPTTDEQNSCVQLIEDAGELAKSTEGDKSEEDNYARACEIVATPWNEPECAFLKLVSAGGASSESEEEE